MDKGRVVRTILLNSTLFVFMLVTFSVFGAEQVPSDTKPLPGIMAETQAHPPTDKKDEAPSAGRIIAAVVFIVVIFGGFIGYMFYLQRKFYQGCREDKQMAVFFNSPAGLPVGTIRAIIALIIITVSLSLITISVFVPTVGEFPTVLVGLLGTVLGFYFGSRNAGPGDDAAQEQIKELKGQRDEAVVMQEQSQADSILSKVKSGLSVSKAALQFLPEAERKKYGDVVSKIEQGLTVAEGFSKSGDLKQAAAKAGEIYDLFKKENPAQDTFSKAVSAFGQVLGNSVPAIAIASSVVILCTKLAGAIYQKWKARILQAPFSPAIMNLTVADANTGMTLLSKSRIFRKAFQKELDGNDRPFAMSVMTLPGQADVEGFWTQYKDRFESRAEFEEGLSEYRRLVADMELESYVTSSLPAEVGGYKGFTAAIDRIGADNQAKAALDQLVVVTDSLHKSGLPVPAILEKMKSGVQP